MGCWLRTSVPIFSVSQVNFFAGGVVGYGTYENPVRGRVYRGALGYPFVGMEIDNVSLNLGVIQPLQSWGRTAICMLHLGIRF